MKAFHHIPRHSGKSVYISYLVGEFLKEELTTMESVSFFFLFTFILMKGQVKILCLPKKLKILLFFNLS